MPVYAAAVRAVESRIESCMSHSIVLLTLPVVNLLRRPLRGTREEEGHNRIFAPAMSPSGGSTARVVSGPHAEVNDTRANLRGILRFS